MAAVTDYKGILDNLTTAVIVVDRDLRIAYLNPAAESMLETSLLRVRNLRLASLLLETDSSVNTLQTAVATGQTYTRRESEFLLATGNRLIVDYSVTPFG